MYLELVEKWRQYYSEAYRKSVTIFKNKSEGMNVNLLSTLVSQKT